MSAGTSRADDAAPDAAGTAEPTIVQIVAEYAEAGFSADAFVTEDGRLLCGSCGATSEPGGVEVHSIRRLEGHSDPADMSGVLALVCPACGARATAVLRFGPEADAGEQAIWLHTQDRRDSATLPPDSTPAEDERG